MKTVYSVKWSISSCIFGLSLLTVPAFANAGGESSGGGTVVYRRGDVAPILLDLYLRDPQFKDPTTDLADHLTPDCSNINQSDQGEYGFSNIFTYGSANLKNATQGYTGAIQKVLAWSNSSPVMSQLLLVSLNSSFFMVTYGLIPQVDSYWLPEGFQSKDIRFETVAFYQAMIGAIVSANVYNKLGLVSQEGLWIHEALRELQIGFGDPISEELLQKMTATILLDQPELSDTLDNPSLYGEGLSRVVSSQPVSNELVFAASQTRSSTRHYDFLQEQDSPELQDLFKVFKTDNVCVSSKP